MSPRTATITLPPRVTGALLAMVGLGVASFAIGVSLAPQRAWADLLMSCYFMLELSLAAIFFLAVHYVTSARWEVAIRRIPEAMAMLLPIGAAGVLIVLFVRPELYPWFEQPASGTRALAFKEAWLSRPFFLARSVGYVVCWIVFALKLVRNSYRQDSDAHPALGRLNVRLSAGFLVVLAVTLVPASFDWIMSLEPVWYSTIFAFYDFASMFLGGLAVMVILLIWVWRLAPRDIEISAEHLHDLGKLLLGFATFWAYLWFSQYMLIWYGNISEETTYFVDRLRGPWAVLFVVNPLLNWAVPFGTLLSGWAKKSPAMLLTAACSVLAGRLLDLYLGVLPRFVGEQSPLGVTELGIMAGAVGLFTLVFFRNLGAAPLMPVRDPHIYPEHGVGSEI